MAVITEINLQKNKKRASVFVDNAFFCGLMVETIVANRLKVGQEVDENDLKRVITESETKRACEYLLSLISAKMYSKNELKTKLKNKGYESEVIENAIHKLEECGYINDEDYARLYAQSAGLKSARQIQQKLFQKGINCEIVQNAVNECKIQGEEDKIRQISAKYMRNREKSAENLQKLKRYLFSKGFSYDDINKIVGEDGYESWN